MRTDAVQARFNQQDCGLCLDPIRRGQMIVREPGSSRWVHEDCAEYEDEMVDVAINVREGQHVAQQFIDRELHRAA